MGALSSVVKLLSKGMGKKTPRVAARAKEYKQNMSADDIAKRDLAVANRAKAAKRTTADPKKAPVTMPKKMSFNSIGNTKNQLAKMKLKLKAGDYEDKAKLVSAISILEKRVVNQKGHAERGVKYKAKEQKKMLRKGFEEAAESRRKERYEQLKDRLNTATGKKRRAILKELQNYKDMD